MGKAAIDFFTPEQKEAIKLAVQDAELETSGEIRVHVENTCDGDVLDRAATVFDKLGMTKTEQRNGVLFYLAVKSHKFAILGDMGINAKVPEDFWESIKAKMVEHFREEHFTEGLVEGITLAGKELKAWFPYQTDDVNELPDDISFGKS
ncbi:MAG: TPM domain-containing protein [Bacteroidetes bacterium]|nr:MAG: TPM domain-containing protein [Bacteroidota bacterium]